MPPPTLDYSGQKKPPSRGPSPAFKWTMVAFGIVLAIGAILALGFFLLMYMYGKNP